MNIETSILIFVFILFVFSFIEIRLRVMENRLRKKESKEDTENNTEPEIEIVPEIEIEPRTELKVVPEMEVKETEELPDIKVKEPTIENIIKKRYENYVGFYISPSKKCNCSCELCTRFAGVYPNSFVFRGWHEGCTCEETFIPLHKYRDGYTDMETQKIQCFGHDVYVSDNKQIKYIPFGLASWISENNESMKLENSYPDFVRYNTDIIKASLFFYDIENQAEAFRCIDDAVRMYEIELERIHVLLEKLEDTKKVYNVNELVRDKKLIDIFFPRIEVMIVNKFKSKYLENIAYTKKLYDRKYNIALINSCKVMVAKYKSVIEKREKIPEIDKITSDLFNKIQLALDNICMGIKDSEYTENKIQEEYHNVETIYSDIIDTINNTKDKIK